MALDPYRICPCGSGKKAKFCCSKDILTELDKVIRAIDGEQRVAALDQVVKLIETKGPRPALLSLKANLQLAMSALEDAESTITELAKLGPHNSSTIALRALLDAQRGKIDEAVDSLQRAMEYAEGEITSAVYAAVGAVALGLGHSGCALGARGHSLLQISLSGGEDKRPLSLILELDQIEDLSPLFKEDFGLEAAPPDVPWLGEFNAALGSARRGTWRAACESLSSLSQKAPGQPAILRNMAILQGWLGNEEEASRMWHAYAALPGVALDDAVEAEALAQELGDEQDVVRQSKVTYPVREIDRLTECLLSDKRCVGAPLDEFAVEDGQPPPRGLFSLLDRPVPAPDAEVTQDDVPRMIGLAAVYGKETDRESRLEFLVHRASEVAGCQKLLAEVAGEWLGEPGTAEEAGELPLHDWLFLQHWYLPPDTPPDKVRQLFRELQREPLFVQWPAMPLAALGGKTPRDAAQDPALRIPVLASILLLELNLDRRFQPDDFNTLREQLGLPRSERIDPANVDVLKMPILRLLRLHVSQLTDDQLMSATQRSIIKHLRPAMYELASAVLSRPSLESRINKDGLFNTVFKCAPDSAAALHWAEVACRSAEAAGASPAQWLIAKLSVHIARGEPEEAGQVLQLLKNRHLKEPGVAQSLAQVLAGYGLLRNGASAADPAAAAAPAEAAEAKKIWTPDSASAPASSAKSKLWVPGMS
jgi:tetratricopeptide (TPR) repeat protein